MMRLDVEIIDLSPNDLGSLNSVNKFESNHSIEKFHFYVNVFEFERA